MDRPHRESRQRNGITVRSLSQLTFATKSAIIGSAPLFDHLVSQREHGRGDSDTERLRGFQIDDQSELVRLLYREIAGLRAAKNFGDLTTSATSLILPIC